MTSGENSATSTRNPGPDVSIILPNWNGDEIFVECVESILIHTTGVDFELILVDNGSTDRSRDAVAVFAANDQRVTAILNDENLWFAHACNQGFEISRGRYILIANNDILLEDDAVTALCRYADRHPDVGVVTPRFIGRDGEPQEFVRRLPNALYILAHYHRAGRAVDRFMLARRLQSAYFYRDRRFLEVEEIEQAGATFSLFRRQTIEDVGGLFDEQFPLLFNDVDLYRRIKDKGITSHVVPSIRIVHFAGVSTRKLEDTRHRTHQDLGMFRYFRKHHPWQYALLALAWPMRWMRTTI